MLEDSRLSRRFAASALLSVSLCLFAVLHCRDAFAAENDVHPDVGVIFNAANAEAAHLFDASGYWTPQWVDIDRLNLALKKYLSQDRHRQASSILARLSDYRKQYIGYVGPDKKRKIYTNAFCKAEFPSIAQWDTRFISVFDGGDCFFQAVYDLDSGEIENMHVNGYA